MSTVAELLAPIRSSPLLPDVAREIDAILSAERERRTRFYQELTPEMKAEFIDGEVVLHSPARLSHLLVSSHIYTLLNDFVRRHDLGVVLYEKCLCVFPRNDYEPDIVFFTKDRLAALPLATMKFPPPDLIVEILSESTEERDRGVKFDDYEAHGVREYWIVDPEGGIVEQYVKADDGFELRMKSTTGDLKSQVISGFTAPIPAFFDAALNHETVEGFRTTRQR